MLQRGIGIFCVTQNPAGNQLGVSQARTVSQHYAVWKLSDSESFPPRLQRIFPGNIRGHDKQPFQLREAPTCSFKCYRDHWLFTASLFKIEWCDSLLHRLSFAISSAFLWGRVTKPLSQRHWVEHVPWACWKATCFGVVIRMWRKEGMGDPLGLTSGLANMLPDAQACPSTSSHPSFFTCKMEQWYWFHHWSA